MADVPRAHGKGDIIPLYPDRTERQRVRLSRKLVLPLRENAGAALRFLSPALLFALAASALAFLCGRVAATLGAQEVSAFTLASLAGQWTLLASTGCALAGRAYDLARSRWR